MRKFDDIMLEGEPENLNLEQVLNVIYDDKDSEKVMFMKALKHNPMLAIPIDDKFIIVDYRHDGFVKAWKNPVAPSKFTKFRVDENGFIKLSKDNKTTINLVAGLPFTNANVKKLSRLYVTFSPFFAKGVVQNALVNISAEMSNGETFKGWNNFRIDTLLARLRHDLIESMSPEDRIRINGNVDGRKTIQKKRTKMNLKVPDCPTCTKPMNVKAVDERKGGHIKIQYRCPDCMVNLYSRDGGPALPATRKGVNLYSRTKNDSKKFKNTMKKLTPKISVDKQARWNKIIEMGRDGISQSKIAKVVGISGAVVSQVINRKAGYKNVQYLPGHPEVPKAIKIEVQMPDSHFGDITSDVVREPVRQSKRVRKKEKKELEKGVVELAKIRTAKQISKDLGLKVSRVYLILKKTGAKPQTIKKNVGGLKMTNDPNRPSCCGKPCIKNGEIKTSRRYKCVKCGKHMSVSKLKSPTIPYTSTVPPYMSDLSPGEKAARTKRLRKLGQIPPNHKPVIYDGSNKNIVRDEIYDLIKSREIKKIMTLETHQFSFAKKFDDTHTIIVAENNPDEYIRMMNAPPPENTIVVQEDVAKVTKITTNSEALYLDFCGGLDKNIGKIKDMVKELSALKIVGFTFCIRGHKDYQNDVQNKLSLVLGPNFVPVYRKPYRDTAPMFTIFYENVYNSIKAQILEEIKG